MARQLERDVETMLTTCTLDAWNRFELTILHGVVNWWSRHPRLLRIAEHFVTW